MQLRNQRFASNPDKYRLVRAPSFDLVPVFIFDLPCPSVPRYDLRAALETNDNSSFRSALRPSLRTHITHDGAQYLLLGAVQLHRFLRSSVLLVPYGVFVATVDGAFMIMRREPSVSWKRAAIKRIASGRNQLNWVKRGSILWRDKKVINLIEWWL